MNTPRTFVVSIGLFLSVTAAHAVTLASYQFGTTDGAVTSTATNVTGSLPSWTVTTGTFGFGASTGSAYATTSGLTTAFDENTKYMTFTLSAAPGHVLNLTSLSFDLGGNTSTASSGTLSTQLYTNTGVTPYGAAAPLSPGPGTIASHTILSTDVSASGLRYTNFTFDLSGADYQGRESISFCFHLTSTTISNNLFARMDNITVNGAVEVSSIPEPSSATVLAGAAALGLVACKRRRSK